MDNLQHASREKYFHEIMQLCLDKSFLVCVKIYTAESSLENTDILTWVKIEYEERGKSYCLLYDSFNMGIYNFRDQLVKVLNNELLLDSSIKKSLGFYQSQYYKKNNRKNLKYVVSDEGRTYWIGYRYQLFGSNGIEVPASWLYNDQLGNIVLEITPIYPWFFSEPKPGEVFIKYSEWMKTYKPILIRTITKETAEQWLKQIDELIEAVKKNDERLRCTGIGCAHCAKIGKTGCHCGSLLVDEKKHCC